MNLWSFSYNLAKLRFSDPPAKIYPRAFSGQRQGWKTPKRTHWQCTASVCVAGVYCWEISLGLADTGNMIFSLSCWFILEFSYAYSLCRLLVGFLFVLYSAMCFGSFGLFVSTCQAIAVCMLRGCKNRHAPFPGRISYKATKPGLVSVLYFSML